VEDADQRQLGRLVSLVAEVLGPDVAGAYLFGSAVLGGLQPPSDLDVLVVSRRATTRAEKEALVDRLLSLSKRPRHLELTIVAGEALDFQYGDWWRREFESGDVEPWSGTGAANDLAVLIAMVLTAGRPLLGPPPAEVLAPVSREDLVRAMLDGIDSLLADLDDDTRNVVLTLARIWTTLGTGEFRSKDAAADWALERLPEEHRAVLGRARAIYLGEEPERWEDLRSQVRPHADHVVGEIEGAVNRPASAPGEPLGS
jgi:predicted nucleotidyltransferase